MSNFYSAAKAVENADKLAELYLQRYYKGREISYPINPFQMLVDEGIRFAIRDFGKLEGVYIPAHDQHDIPVIGINLNRPITRQRFTAAHELCHYLKDSEEQFCPIGSRTASEVFADQFASSLLMPLGELRNQVKKRMTNGYVDFEHILEIAHFFGVSFDACVYKVAYYMHAVQGNTKSNELKKKIRKFKPDGHRKVRGFNNVALYEDLIDSYESVLRFSPNEFALNVFQNNYIYNDSRMEGVNIDPETSAEIVTDIRLSMQNSKYCTEENEAFLSVAGHAAMYSYIFELPVPGRCSVFDTVLLHKRLYSCYPHPEFGGQFRDNNTLVLGGKFETVDHKEILPRMIKIDDSVRLAFEQREEISISSYIKSAVKLHHELTVIHPFGDGNGRALRAFFNTMMVRNDLTPVYIKVEDKNEYIAALAAADNESNYAPLYEFFFRAILRTSVELTR